ncbi:hypothetical protein NQ527_11895 [Eshraghiella crossota]|uniref:Uncharacterized protein n=1 Tax=Eshraghiella crossota DSM 2876 TaxID=511680 RepID=D4RXR0_9FIRM|nr:hypothetical protein [Butyrivibrio crossotus]EFF69142.1 hypothetical protein BUTYVIB_00611 [Butyrivibrio crossotus DSM 2876]UWO50602.1 hypothetical protein NQ527_11895 [Butyrivibrio crossotus]
MTSQEARQQLNACESQITGTYSNLCDSARSMGASTSQAASSKTTMSTLLPLIISLVGLVLMFASHPVWGIILIIVGCVVAYNSHQTAASVQKNVEQQVNNLNNVINNNSRI